MSNILLLLGLHCARLSCPSLSPRVCSHLCTLSQLCHSILCCSLHLLSSIFPSMRVFSNELVLLIRWPKYWSFNCSISPPNEYSGLISFRTDCFDLLAVQGTLKSHLKHHNSKASILQHSSFFTDQLSHPYLTTGKTIALMDLWTFVGKVMSLLLTYCLGLSIAFLQEAIILFHGCSHHPHWF